MKYLSEAKGEKTRKCSFFYILLNSYFVETVFKISRCKTVKKSGSIPFLLGFECSKQAFLKKDLQ